MSVVWRCPSHSCLYHRVFFCEKDTEGLPGDVKVSVSYDVCLKRFYGISKFVSTTSFKALRMILDYLSNIGIIATTFVHFLPNKCVHMQIFIIEMHLME